MYNVLVMAFYSWFCLMKYTCMCMILSRHALLIHDAFEPKCQNPNETDSITNRGVGIVFVVVVVVVDFIRSLNPKVGTSATHVII